MEICVLIRLMVLTGLMFLVGCSESGGPSSGGGNPAGGGSYPSQITVNSNVAGSASVTVSGNGSNNYLEIPLDFGTAHNSVQMTMISAYVDANSQLKVQLWANGTHLLTEDITVSGALNRSLATKTGTMPTMMIITSTNFLGSLALTLAACSL